MNVVEIENRDAFQDLLPSPASDLVCLIENGDTDKATARIRTLGQDDFVAVLRVVRQLDGNLVAVTASISIPSLEGIVTREATGCEDADAKGYGDACSNAEAMALKRAASKFGLGLHLYQK